MITIISIIFAVIVVYITDNSGTEGKEGELILPGLFVVAHPLSCITGLLTTKTQMFSPSVGWLFALCTLIGILELIQCKEILKPFGGHVWYVFFLSFFLSIFQPTRIILLKWKTLHHLKWEIVRLSHNIVNFLNTGTTSHCILLSSFPCRTSVLPVQV